MKKITTKRIVVLMLALTLLTCCFVGSTFAKYTSSAAGNSAARVALWDIKYNGTTIETVGSAKNVTFDLFESVNDVNVKDGDDENIIAPGTNGSFTYTVTNNSEVNAEYAIDYTVTNANNIPVQFRVKLDSGEYSDWSNTLEDVAFTAIAMGTGSAEYLVEWQWIFNGDDAVDTTLGLAGTATITVDIAITVNQVD